jgi:ABC-2 type transport system permease protein
MSELIRFSLKRRFLNKTFLVSQILLVILIGCLLNIDKLASFFGFTSTGYTPVVFLDGTMKIEEEIANNYGFTLKNEAEIKVLSVEDGFRVEGITGDMIQRLQMQSFLTTLHKNAFLFEHNPSVIDLIAEYEGVTIEFAGESIVKPVGRENFVFMILTAVYFMVLNFTAMTSNEVVGEKAANVLDMILSATDVDSHYRSKLLSGWLTMFLQGGFAMGFFGFFAYLRNQEDLGRGLLIWGSQFGLVDRSTVSFRILIEKMNLDLSFGLMILLCILFLFCGMALIQTLMMVIATKLKSAEEASILQGPVYVFLLIFYYIALSQNTAPRLAHGFGYIASFIPLGSMLFMPMRLLLVKVGILEVMLSGCIAVSALIAAMWIGQKIYVSQIRQKNRKGLLRRNHVRPDAAA